MKGRKAQQVALTGMFVALAFVLSYIENIIPISIGIPGVKLGLANLVVMVALYTLGYRDALFLSIIRIVLVGFTFGSLASMMYSLAGGLLSFLVMVLAKKSEKLSISGVSVLGGVSHNLGQLLIAMLLVENGKLFFYFPVLCLSGTVAGIGIGLLAAMVTKRVKKVLKHDKE